MNNAMRGRLTVTRMSGESLQIGDDIVVTVRLEPNRKGTVRVTVDAPRDIKVLRSELVGHGPGQ